VDARLGDYVRGQWPALVRYAAFLCGDVNEAEELVQSALVRVAARWPFVTDKDNPDPYVRWAVLRGFLSKKRRLWGREASYADVPDLPSPRESSTAVDDRVVVRAALATLPPRQRAVVVLRYFDDLTEQQAAEVLGCSVGTVKSQASKALAKLRAVLEPDGESVGGGTR
jgi:RNA polymerase sigma-70 factor (sigma-E family)